MITIDSQPVEDVLRFCKDKDEINALASMRATVCEKLEVMTADDFEGLQQERPDAYGNLRLLRCLRKAKVQDPVSSADRFLRYISWRVENGVDELSLDNGVLSFCKENFNVEVGREVSIKVGDWNTRKLLKAIDSTQQSMSTQQFLHFWVLTYEEIHRHLHRLSMEDGKSLAFVDIHADMSSLSVTQFSSSFIRRVGRPWVTMTQAHYPETTRKIFFMNSPSAISVAWRIIGKFVSKGTKEKIIIS